MDAHAAASWSSRRLPTKALAGAKIVFLRKPGTSGRATGYCAWGFFRFLFWPPRPAYMFASPSGPTEAMRTMLVVPGMPSGTPATMITRWPARTKPSRNAIWPARATMSS